MNRHERRAAQSFVRQEAKSIGPEFVEVPKDRCPDIALMKQPPINAYWNNRFLVQVYKEPGGIRLSVIRRELQRNGDYVDGISWDELQDIKRALGYGDHYAIEIYPRDRDLVNVANMRHLWVMNQPLAIGWFNHDR